MNYLATHLGEGKFEVKMENGKIKQAGPSLCGMIRFTYFEDYSLPEVGWQVTRVKLMEDYLPKMHKKFAELQKDKLNNKP